MAPWFDGGWPPYVPVAERRKQAAREMEKLRKKGHPVAPVILEGRTIARTFWGKAWCENLESYRDFDNRLPRGRIYVRNGAVIDLQISALEIKAVVSGSSIYRVSISITALAPAAWRSICAGCAGGIDSLVELLQGRFSKGVMERLCCQDRGLFPKPSDIRFSCTCPDGALMCKHVAAVLYGVGARLDEAPELLFRLRAVDEKDLVANLDTALPISNRPLDIGKILETDDISALFGLDMAETGDAIPSPDAMPATPEPLARTGQKRTSTKAVGHKAVVRPHPAPAAPTANTHIVLPARQIRETSKASKVPHSAEPIAQARPLDASPTRKASKRAQDPKIVKSKGKRTMPKPEIELTPDGFVKWWK
ncbi:SWIM zinc finger family protein [Microvirga sp. BSC39]|uniref:SWIM zinc finger family protein n=1 Tax=Microvirga sp. BSC39 TaxID=1549810 RepID=UPI001269F54D|nr:SWIM zinc finger family protein [Microvirga sp. BSC39]